MCCASVCPYDAVCCCLCCALDVRRVLCVRACPKRAGTSLCTYHSHEAGPFSVARLKMGPHNRPAHTRVHKRSASPAHVLMNPAILPAFHCLSLAIHCLSLAIHCLHWSFTAFNWSFALALSAADSFWIATCVFRPHSAAPEPGGLQPVRGLNLCSVSVCCTPLLHPSAVPLCFSGSAPSCVSCVSSVSCLLPILSLPSRACCSAAPALCPSRPHSQIALTPPGGCRLQSIRSKPCRDCTRVLTGFCGRTAPAGLGHPG